MMLTFNMIIFITIAILFICMPYVTRKTECFGVTIPEDMATHSDVQHLRKRYVKFSAFSQVILLLVFLVGTFLVIKEEWTEALFSGVVVLQIVIMFLLYLYFHKCAKAFKSVHLEMDSSNNRKHIVSISTNFREEKLTVSNYWFLIPLGILILTTIVTLQMYDQIAQQIPLNYDFKGDPVSFTEKTYRSVLLLPAVQLFMTVLFLFVNIIIRTAKQQISGVNPQAALKRNILFRRRWSAFMVMIAMLCSVMFTVLQFSLIYELPSIILMVMPILFTVILLVGCIYLTYTTGQGGSRIKLADSDADAETNPTVNRGDDHYWKLGMFYFNREDPAIFVEKRFGVGWTNNWARPLSWVTIVVIIVLAVGLPLLLSD